MCETNVSFDSCNSCGRLEPNSLHELHEPKHQFISCIKFIRSKLSNCSAHVTAAHIGRNWPAPASRAARANICHVAVR